VILRTLDRVRRTLLTGAAFVFFFTGGALLSYLVLPLVHAWPGTPSQRSRRCRLAVGRAWVLFHDYMRVAAILRYDPRTIRLALPQGPFVLVANHPTLVDVTALVASFPDVAIVAKAAMFRSPLVGRLLRYCDHIRSDESPFGGAAVVDGALERLARGTPVLIFPEGTRSPPRAVGAIRPGAFDVAARARVPVVAVLIRCEPPTLLRGDPWYAIPERAPDLTVERLATIEVGRGDADGAARRLQEAYANAIAQPLRDARLQKSVPTPSQADA
jgi:1-acyl-sn-glycerol-3-phosphate acyltransferase